MEAQLARIREGGPEDAEALTDVYAEAWRSAYQGIIPHLQLERMIARRGPGWWDAALSRNKPVLVLEFDGKAQGYVSYGRSRMIRSRQQGEIFELYLHPIYQGLGFGGQLFGSARRELVEARLKGLVIWALADNDSACSFYLGLGGEPVAEGAERFGDTSLRKIAFAWK